MCYTGSGAHRLCEQASESLELVPIILVYPFIQKYFVRGVFIGSIKG